MLFQMTKNPASKTLGKKNKLIQNCPMLKIANKLQYENCFVHYTFGYVYMKNHMKKI